MRLRVARGTLIAASPDLLDPNFMHRVVLMCQHSEEGAYGLVVNQSADLAVSDLLPEHPLLGSSPFPVFLGGPVGRDTLQFVHTVPDAIPGGLELAETLFMGGELDALARYLSTDEEAARSRVRLLVGYSGWGGGQLEAELATGSWLPVPLVAGAVFGDDGERTWRRVVRALGDAAKGLDDLPPDPSWN